MGYDSDFSFLENLLYFYFIRYLEDSELGRCISFEGSKYFGGNGIDYFVVYFYSDVEKCYVVNVVEKLGSFDGEFFLFSLEFFVDEVKERGCNELFCGKIIFMF